MLLSGEQATVRNKTPRLAILDVDWPRHPIDIVSSGSLLSNAQCLKVKLIVPVNTGCDPLPKLARISNANVAKSVYSLSGNCTFHFELQSIRIISDAEADISVPRDTVQRISRD